ncbi:Apolipophorins like protein [Argiope bruennichi]|uniref:Apolipophorins like protein n=1 Tax=Argiope bruennichi TaxID=94029 RepID=A0A8T0F6U8_ARGBR|nr:Apolipophorins like protein [Argiope bruennichi]
MVLRLAILAWLGCLAIAGPVAWDASKCAQKCNGGTKFQYSEQTSYVYKFESSNLLKADGATDLNMGMTATFKVTAVSKCEMVLQVLDVSLKHGTTQETASPFIDELKRNPLPFSWNDGKIEHVCPNPDDSNDVNNIKKAMISALQNSMRTFEANLHDREVDVLGSCNTEYILKENKNEKFVFTKNKDIATCTDHLKGQTLLLATFYESSAHRQHLPLLSGETLTCQQTIENGIIEEVVCDEKAAFKPLYSYGYVVEAEAKITVKKISAEGASAINYRAPKKESLVFKHNPESKKNDNLEVEAQNVLKQICDNSEGLINKNAAHAVHKLVYLIRGLNEGALERIYQSLKSKQLCRSRKALTIYLDALKAASSGGSIALFSKLVENGEVRKTDAFLWMTLLPFTSYVEEESVAATLPLLRKDTARRQALLGVSAMAYKYCTTRSNCEDSNAVKSVSSSLKQFLGDKCQTTNKEEETQIITALKAFGNLGYVGESAESIFECAALTSNQLPIRIAAIQAFRRTPCTESVGGRVEDLEHTLEKLFGPRGLMPNLEINDVLNLIPENLRKRGRRSAESYKSKLESLGERLGYSRGKTPNGSAYIRVLGHELGWVNLHKDVISKRFEDFNIEELVREIVRTKEIDVAKNLLYLDVSILFPSVTGRAYKLAGNASLTLGLKTNGKIELHKNSKILPLSGILLEGIAQPSILLDSSASFTIHSENYEPGVRAETTLSAGLDINGKFEFKDFKLLHIKLSRRQERQELLSLKRTLYSINQNGVREIPKPQSYNLNYCTKYVQYILGARYCVSATIPHIYNDQGKPKIPFVRAMEASVVVEQVDKSMDGYELFLQLPDFSVREERKYKFLLDTPNSEVDRKLSADLTAKRPDAETTIIALKTYSPFYSLDVNVDVNNRADAFRLKADALGNQKRRYSLLMDVGKDVRGARLVEYQPKISLILPNVRPIELSGTIVFSKGRKALVSINMQSNSFDSPLNIKGNLAQEGDIDLEEDWKVSSELNITAFSQIHRLQSSLGNLGGKGLYLDLGHHYEPDGRSYESVTVNAKLENVELRDRLQFSLDAKVLLAEHQDLNSHFRWDFSVKPLGHFKNDVLFRYGENFEDNKHLVRLTQKVALHGDFDTFQHMDLENKLGLTISCFDFDKSAALSVVWDFEKRPKLFVEVGVKSSPDREISLKYDYRHVSNKPLKLVADGKLVFYDHKVLYRDHVEEVARNEYRGQAVLTPREGKDITINYVYKIKSQTHFHHELDGTVSFPATQTPVKIKADLEITSDSLKLNSIADSGSRAYSIDMNLQKTGASRVALNTPYIEGNVNVDSQNGDHSVRADIKTVGKDDRRIVITGNIAQNDITTLTLDIQWDADKDSEKKLSIKAKTNKATENGIDKHMITAQISYEGSINVDVTGKISTDLLRGPHYFRADFSGNMESMAIEYTHEIKNGEVESVAKYLRSNVEKLKLNMKGKYVLTGTKFQIEYGLFLTSPYKTFDGKELYFQIMADSTETARTFIAEYRIKPATVIGYVGKIDYIRKRGWPGQITSNLLVTVHQRPVYEGNTLIEYGNGKYSWKTSFTPISKKKINLLTHFEHSAKFAAFHHSMASTLEYLQKVELNAVADLRNTEDAKVYSNLDVNHHKMYDANATMKIRSMVDFEGQLVILSKITPSFHLFYRTQPSGQLTKYDMNLDVDSVNLIAGSGEIKKRKKGVNADMVFKYKEKEFLNLNINQEIKSKSERNYVIKVKTPWRSYTSYIKVAKEKKGKEIKYETKFCRNEKDQCISIDVTHKELADGDEWQIAYERGDVAFSIERIRISTNELSRFHTVIYNGDVRYGYDLRFAKEENGHSVSLGIILPSREIVTKTYGEISLRKPRVKFEFQTDARKHPERKLITDIRFENHLADNSPSKLDVIISHPTYEKMNKIWISRSKQTPLGSNEDFGDYKKQCYKLIVYTEEGETSRIIEVCVNSRSRKILSIVTESLDDEGQWTFDFSLDIVRKSWRTIKIMSHYSPEFLGQFLFKATAFGDELTTAGVRFLPMYDSPRFKKIRNSFHSKIFQPTLRFFIPEAAKFIADLRRDTTFAVVKLRNYYNSLPPFTEINKNPKKSKGKKATGIVKAVCHNNEDCKAFVNAFNDGGWKGLANQIKIFIQSIPQKIRNFMERPGVDARKFYDKAMILVKAALQPLTKYKCGEIVVKIVQLTYTAVEPHIQSFLENYPRYYRTIRQAIVTNKYVIQATKIAQDAFSRLRSEVEKIDFEKLISIGKHYIEDFLFNFTPPSPKSATTINAFDIERGHVDFDIHFGVSQSYPVKVLTRILDRVTNLVERLVFHREQFSSQALLVKFKRGADLNFFPPYEAQAMLVGNHHFVTFDKVFYDFAGECTYLLSRDFEDGNFTFALKPSAGEKGPSILALINDKSIEVNSGDQIISVDDNAVELPYLTKEFTVSRSGSTVIIDDKHGVKVKCNLVYQICTFSITGWYFGKTAGLLGTYNYEPSDEFKRPKGQVANSPSVLAKSFELKKGCKSNNLVPEVKIKENSDYYKLCKEHFESTSSPLSACFYEVKPEEYFQLCLRHLARASDPAKSLCNIAAAYVMECERNYIELNLPSKCITCSAPDGSTLQQGDRKKYENLSKKSADVVFIVEDHECNKAIVNDLGNLARSIERELQNDGFKDVMFGAVGYGADIGNPQIYTVKEAHFSIRGTSIL